MKTLLNTKSTKVILKTGLAILLGSNIACGEAPTHYNTLVDEGPSIPMIQTEVNLEPSIDLESDLSTGILDGADLSKLLEAGSAKPHQGIVSNEIGQAHYREATTEKDRGIPTEFPDLLGEESATFEISLGTKTFRLTAQDRSFEQDLEVEHFVLSLTDTPSDAMMKLTTSMLDPSTQVGAGKNPDPAIKLTLGETEWTNLSNGECAPAVVFEIDDKSELALWGRIKGTLCDGEVEREFAGTFAALKPGIRALQ